MPRPKKKTPLTQSAADPDTPDAPDPSSEPTPSPSLKKEKTSPRRTPYLSLEEKRKWLACIVRDTSGQHQGFEIGMGDKFKALVEDNKLAGHPGVPEEDARDKQSDDSRSLPELLRTLLSTVTPPQQQHFSRQKK